MQVKTYVDRKTMSGAAAEHAASLLRDCIAARGLARIIAATGASQLDFLGSLVTAQGIDWARVEMFHLDEYVGLPASHPASFRRYLLDRLIRPTGMSAYHLLDGEQDAQQVADRIGSVISSAPIDVAFVGIGENGHLAFNDPPADFTNARPYLLVTLDDACRRQQVGEGWFATVDDVPSQAISMSVTQIMRSRTILCIVPDARKADAVHACLEGDISPMAPASILQRHSDTTVYLDRLSAARLSPATRGVVRDDERL